MKTFAACVALTTWLSLPTFASGPAAATSHPAQVAPTASEVLDRLQGGNKRFIDGTPERGHQSAARRKELEAGQQPFATVLGCSDSRVPVELVFDQGLGDLFVVRVAGNVVDRDDLGSIEYAVDHLNTPLVLVMGHESCGAVTSALLPEAARLKESPGIQALLLLILPGLKDLDPALGPEERVHLGVEANVRRSVSQLQETPDLKDRIEAGRLKVVGAVYELKTGKVRMLK